MDYVKERLLEKRVTVVLTIVVTGGVTVEDRAVLSDTETEICTMLL